jgi:hypothetical protein
MLHRFYDIKIENEKFEEIALSQEYVLDVPEHDMSTPLERQEHIGQMFDILTAASGLNVCSFSTDSVLS